MHDTLFSEFRCIILYVIDGAIMQSCIREKWSKFSHIEISISVIR